VIVCVDDAYNIEALSQAATRHNATLEVLVEIDVGAGRCGVSSSSEAIVMAQQIASVDGLLFAGLQAYQGTAQHVRDYAERKARIDTAIDKVRDTVALLASEGLDCDIVGGAGTGTYYFEGESGVYNEVQSGSYVFMDADYQQVKDADGSPSTSSRTACSSTRRLCRQPRRNRRSAMPA